MAWKIRFDESIEKSLRKLGSQAARRVTLFLHERIALLDDPRSIGETLQGAELGKYWKYRVGDYRIICRIEDKELCVLVVRVGNRRDVYK